MSRREVWRCVASHTGWFQAAILQAALSAAAAAAAAHGDGHVAGTSGVLCPHLAFALWCMCPVEGGDAAPTAVVANGVGTAPPSALRDWARATLAEVTRAAAECTRPSDGGEGRAPSAADVDLLAGRVARWRAMDGAHPPLVWHFLLGATAVSAAPLYWVSLVVHVLLSQQQQQQQMQPPPTMGAMALEWMWHLLNHGLLAPAAAPATITAAASHGAELVLCALQAPPPNL